MVIYKKKGVKKLMDCVAGRLHLTITGEVREYYDELSMLLTKASYLSDKDCSGVFKCTDGVYSLGSGSTKKTIDASELFGFFEVKHVTDEIPSEVKNVRNTGLVYFTSLGETALHNSTFNNYTFNDGSTILSTKLSSSGTVMLKKDVMIRFMPDLYKEIKKSEKAHEAKLVELGLVGLVEGSRVRIKTYAELLTKFDEQILVMGEDDNVVTVESSEDPDAVRFIKQLGYSKLSADYYDNKVGTIVSIDVLTGSLVIDINGKTSHTMFMDEGTEQSNSGEGVLFTLEHIVKV